MNDYGLNNDKRNYLLDFFRGVAAISVVLVHFRFPGITGKIMTSVGTAGVVLFFLIGGYFAYSEDNEAACGKIIERFKRNLVITLIAVLVYFVFTAVREALIGNIAAWAAKFTNPVVYLRMIVMGDFEVINSDPLWFMPALLYSYLILWCIHKFRIKKSRIHCLAVSSAFAYRNGNIYELIRRGLAYERKLSCRWFAGNAAGTFHRA